MPNVVFDASTLVGALLKAGSVPGRASLILQLITAGAVMVEPAVRVQDCRDAKDNKYLELALAARSPIIVASDDDLLALHPWRGIAVMTPAEYVVRLA